MNRRRFLLLVAAGTVTGIVARERMSGSSATGQTPHASPAPLAAPVRAQRGTYVPGTLVDRLPGTGNRIALTIDDGVSSEVVAGYIQFAKDTHARLTFFVNGVRSSWTDNAPELRPMVESGQIQLANHTWSHPSLPTLSDAAIGQEIDRNERFLIDTYGVSGRPYLRPPYAHYDDRTRRVATEHGYWVTTVWYGSLGDSDPNITEAELLANAREWIQAQRIVIGHANLPPITHLYGQLADIIRERHLQTVTLNDVFSTR